MSILPPVAACGRYSSALCRKAAVFLLPTSCFSVFRWGLHFLVSLRCLPVPCSDVHCGRIQCQGGRERPLLGTNAEILTTNVSFNHSYLICRGTFFHLGDDVSDPATVAQGTACGPGKVSSAPCGFLSKGNRNGESEVGGGGMSRLSEHLRLCFRPVWTTAVRTRPSLAWTSVAASVTATG